MRSDFFNEALVTAMLAASTGRAESPPTLQPSSQSISLSVTQASSQNSTLANEELTQAHTLRTHLATLMDQARKAALQKGMPADLVETADFAVCAFIDETLLSSPTWPGRTDWMKRPLQFTRHDTATGGEDFYRLLDSLMEQCKAAMPDEPLPASGQTSPDLPHTDEQAHKTPLQATLEVFALCLAQGFTGMYYGEPEKIHQTIQNIGKHVPSVASCEQPFFFVPQVQVREKGSLSRVSGAWNRFDLLDLLLWSTPPALTILLYHICNARLDQLILPFLQGGPKP